ncbi:N-6 DNA methylase [Catellatospora sp. NPDC049111]|uniref:N-6 DNA methylase n=1 Tax=Catellatospora sp. NPDC049111 TaxID=3155271 RepID=UPI0033E42868
MAVTDDALVTLAEIARIARVGRAAVSNWRRRHESFPKPVGGTDASPLFSLAQVEIWLQQNRRLDAVEGLDRLWPRFDGLGDRAASGRAIAELGLRAVGVSARSGFVPEGSVSLAADELIRSVGDGPPNKVFDFLFDRWRDAYVKQLSLTSTLLADLMLAVAIAASTRPIADDAIILDPACGAGGLLVAAKEYVSASVVCGVDSDATLAAMCAARLLLHGPGHQHRSEGHIDVRVGDSLRADPLADLRADLVLAVPPFNEREWGHEQLATDARWVYGIPPRTESELAWVQHALARLNPGGTAVLMLPPAVAVRRAGRRIRGALVRSGAVRGIVSLPAGANQPFGVPLHLWVLEKPQDSGRSSWPEQLLLMDATNSELRSGAGHVEIDWPTLRERVTSAFRTFAKATEQRIAPDKIVLPPGCAAVATVRLLDDLVDLTPARHVPASNDKTHDPQTHMTRFGNRLQQLGHDFGALSSLKLTSGDKARATISISDLERASALRIRAGQVIEDALASSSDEREAVPVLTIPDLMLSGRPGLWVSAERAASLRDNEAVTEAQAGDVVVVGAERAYRAWVHTGSPVLLGPQLFLLSIDEALLDPWFLAGCLRAPANARQAGTHAAATSRIDVRRLQVLQLPLEQQRRYGTVFRSIADLEQSVAAIHEAGTELVRTLSDHLGTGRSELR